MPLFALPTLALIAPGWVINLLAAGFVLSCLFMMLVILIQKPKGGGLSGAFGGAGGGNAQAAFGAKVGDVLTWATVACFILFVLLAMFLTWTINPTVAGQEQPRMTPGDQTTTEQTDPEDATEGADADTDADADADAGDADAGADAQDTDASPDQADPQAGSPDTAPPADDVPIPDDADDTTTTDGPTTDGDDAEAPAEDDAESAAAADDDNNAADDATA